MKALTVEGPWCHLCPLWGTGSVCQATEGHQETFDNADGTPADEGAPDWCPLRSGPVQVSVSE